MWVKLSRTARRCPAATGWLTGKQTLSHPPVHKGYYFLNSIESQVSLWQTAILATCSLIKLSGHKPCCLSVWLGICFFTWLFFLLYWFLFSVRYSCTNSTVWRGMTSPHVIWRHATQYDVTPWGVVPCNCLHSLERAKNTRQATGLQTGMRNVSRTN